MRPDDRKAMSMEALVDGRCPQQWHVLSVDGSGLLIIVPAFAQTEPD